MALIFVAEVAKTFGIGLEDAETLCEFRYFKSTK